MLYGSVFWIFSKWWGLVFNILGKVCKLNIIIMFNVMVNSSIWFIFGGIVYYFFVFWFFFFGSKLVVVFICLGKKIFCIGRYGVNKENLEFNGSILSGGYFGLVFF